jgi:hypothetical protein
MSMDLHVLFRATDALTVPAWQEALASLGLPATLPLDFEVEGDGGYAPVAFRGEPSGFEFYRASADPDTIAEAGLEPETYDQMASFTWGGDLNEMGAAVCAGAALTLLTGGVLYFPQDGDVLTGRDAVAWAMEAVNAV